MIEAHRECCSRENLHNHLPNKALFHWEIQPIPKPSLPFWSRNNIPLDKVMFGFRFTKPKELSLQCFNFLCNSFRYIEDGKETDGKLERAALIRVIRPLKDKYLAFQLNNFF